MRNIFVILTILSCLFSYAVNAGQQNNHLRENLIIQVATQAEIQILSENCWAIRTHIVLRHGPPQLSSGCRNLIKREITNYLNSVGTPIARQLLSEFQANDFLRFM